MDFDSPDVEKDFPGLYASESGTSRKKDEDDFSEGEHEKLSKKELLLGRRKEKKDKKDRGYATLDGESSPEEDHDTKSPSKAKKSKAFKFPSKSKDKREKSRDKDKSEKEVKEKDKESASEGKEKKKDKDKKDKEKKEKKEKDKDKEKVKDKDKEKKEKKLKQTTLSEEILELGDAHPIFGVSLGLAVVRSHCHDNVHLPLVLRDCIDYLQEQGLQSEQLYKVDAVKTKLQHLKKLYNNREANGLEDVDVPTACGLLKLFIKELPEPILTTDLLPRFEEAASLAQVGQQQEELTALCCQLPGANRTLLSWLILHLDAILQHEKSNKMNAQTLAVLLSPTLQMSHRLLVALLCHCSHLFADTVLDKYKPPITSTSTSPNLPETAAEITQELQKQDSLLNQIHAEMNAGFVSKKREEQLWEVQRIITQLKRKLRSFEKKQDSTQKSMDDTVDGEISITHEFTKAKSICSDDESLKTATILSTGSATNTETKTTPQATPDNTTIDRQKERHHKQALDPWDESTSLSDKLYMDKNSLLMLPEDHPEYLNLIRLQLENEELTKWKCELQHRITAERSEIIHLKGVLNSAINSNRQSATAIVYEPNNFQSSGGSGADDAANYERLVAHYLKENTLLEQKKNILAKEIFEENRELIQLQVDLAIKQYQI